MVSEDTETIVRNQLYATLTKSIYYTGLSSYRSSVQTVSQVVTLMSSMGAIVSLMGRWQWVMLIFGAFIAISTSLSFTWNHPSRVSAIQSVSIRCRRLETKADELWRSLRSLDDTEALACNDRLKRKLDRVTDKAEAAGIAASESRNKKAAKRAEKEIQQWYQPPSPPLGAPTA